MAQSPTEQKGSTKLDNAPPGGTGRKMSLMDTPSASNGLGDQASNPQIMALQGMQMVERGVQLLANGVPSLQPMLTQLLNTLSQIVPQAMSANSGGPLAGPPPTGAMPMMTPPPGGAPAGPAAPPQQ